MAGMDVGETRLRRLGQWGAAGSEWGGAGPLGQRLARCVGGRLQCALHGYRLPEGCPQC
jgi:hypothetical protein